MPRPPMEKMTEEDFNIEEQTSQPPAEDGKRKAGRPKGSKAMVRPRQSKMTPQKKRKIIETIKKNGGNQNAACAKVGVNFATHYYHRKHDEVYAEKVEQAIQEACQEVEEAITHRAIDGVDEPIYFQGQLVGYKKAYSDNLLMERARALLPERYGKRQDVNINQNISVSESAKNKLADLLGIKTSEGNYEVEEGDWSESNPT